MKLYTTITSALLSASSLFAADNYFIGETWGGSGKVDQWSLNSISAEDDLFFDAVKYFEAKPSASTYWSITQWVHTDLGTNYVTANSFTVQNLYNPADPQKMTLTISTPSDTSTASTKIAFTITNNFNFVSDSYKSVFTWQSGGTKWPVNTLAIGGDLNVGSASSLSTDGGTVTFGGYKNNTLIKKMTVAGDVNMYGDVKLSLAIGTPDAEANVGDASFKVSGVVNMNKIGDSAPTWVLNNTSNNDSGTNAVLNATIDVGGIQGYGTIKNNTASLAGTSTIIFRNTTRHDFYGTLSDGLATNDGNSKTSLLVASASCVQALRGDVSIAGNIEVRRGTLLLNGAKIDSISMTGFSTAKLGAISVDSDFGTINTKTLSISNNCALLFDINGTNQDIINVSGTFDVKGTSTLIEFASLANIKVGDEYKLIEYGTLGSTTTIDKFQASFLEGWDGELSLRDNALWVTFTQVAVPEPAEWAAIFGAAALALALYRRRK